jgi:biotin/methionine sulfoxide reductase
MTITHSSHWGAFTVESRHGALSVIPHPDDPDPSPLLRNVTDAVANPARISQPMVRLGWLQDGPGSDGRRGRDRFVAVPWPRLLDMLAAEISRVRQAYGNEAIYGGSYGWASAGRFHHAQSQIHRFFNCAGGYVRSVHNYSAGAALVILPHILAPYHHVSHRNITWDAIAKHTDIVLAFGGMAAKNSMVGPGAATVHDTKAAIAAARLRGARFILFSPLRDDMPEEAEAEWIRLKPGLDVAVMLGLAHTLVSENLYDRAFVQTHCTGATEFIDYLSGKADGQARSAEWCEEITGIPAVHIRALARAMRRARVLVNVSQSLQRARYGEQALWAATALAALLGQIGLPGAGFGYGLGSMASIGKRSVAVPLPTLPQLRNPVQAFIPVARVADMLLEPGKEFAFDGGSHRYPLIRLVYWAGGNPFHHHQDINRLRGAFSRPDTIVVNESVWTATARHADIVLPTTTSLEREDIGAAPTDDRLVAMKQAADPWGGAMNDYAIFSELSRRLGFADAFTEGRSDRQWICHLYHATRDALERAGCAAPSFETFWEKGELQLPLLPDDGGPLRAFRNDPSGAPLSTPSGRIELFSRTIADFAYPDCPGHPTWLRSASGEDDDTGGSGSLLLVSNQPARRLHSQLDFGRHSAEGKVAGREPIRLNPADAAARGISDGDVVRVFNSRGACLAGAVVSPAIMPGVAQLSTGAWYDPLPGQDETPLCVHGNPNVLTRDVRTSSLSQACAGQITRVEVERFAGAIPPPRAFHPPGIESPGRQRT